MAGNTSHIRTTDGYTVKVDKEDAALGELTWRTFSSPVNRRRYAVRTDCVDGRKVTTYMHRVITQAQKGVAVDHINLDGLDNRRANLRMASAAENGWNSGKRSRRATSRFKHENKYRRAAEKLFGEFARCD